MFDCFVLITKAFVFVGIVVLRDLGECQDNCDLIYLEIMYLNHEYQRKIHLRLHSVCEEV